MHFFLFLFSLLLLQCDFNFSLMPYSVSPTFFTPYHAQASSAASALILLINEMSIAIQFFVYKHGQKWRLKCIVKIGFIDNLAFKGLMVNSGSKHAFKYGKRH